MTSTHTDNSVTTPARGGARSPPPLPKEHARRRWSLELGRRSRRAASPAWPQALSTRWFAGIAAAGVGAAVATVVLAKTSDHTVDPGASAGLVAWITLPFVFAGLIAWSRRPDSRFGPLMIAAGFATFLTALSWANGALPYTLGQATCSRSPARPMRRATFAKPSS